MTRSTPAEREALAAWDRAVEAWRHYQHPDTDCDDEDALEETVRLGSAAKERGLDYPTFTAGGM